MSFAQAVRGAASAIAQGGDPRQVLSDAVDQAAEQYGLDPADFLAARDQNASVGTRIEQQTTSLANAGEALNRSRYERGPEGPVHVICPMVIPRGRTARALLGKDSGLGRGSRLACAVAFPVTFGVRRVRVTAGRLRRRLRGQPLENSLWSQPSPRAADANH